MMANPDTYTYKPLTQGCQTRVLELLPSPDKTADLHARLVDIDIYTKYDYTALSYTWGKNPKFTEALYLVGNVVGHPGKDEETTKERDDKVDSRRLKNITKNLHDALVRFRDPYQVCRIWVDAVCINQDDKADKARQIPLMDQIYRTANTVLVWLGAHEKEARSLELLNSASRRLDESGIEEKLIPHVQAVVNLEWFTRRWIVQEVVLNDGVQVFCGQRASIPWLRLVSVILHILRSFEATKDLATVRMMAMLAEERRDRHRGHDVRHRGVLEILESFWMMGCANDSDRVYALAGLASDVGVHHSIQELTPDGHHSMAVQVDYEKSVEQVYIDLVAADLKNLAGYTGILRLASQRSDGSFLNKKCSWAPDWRLDPARGDLTEPSEFETSGLSLKDNRAMVVDSRRILKVACAGQYTNVGNANGYTSYAKLEFLSEVFPKKELDEDIKEWVKRTWLFLIIHVSKTMGIPSSTLDLDFLLTQYERLLLERADPLRHSQGAEYYDTFRSSADFKYLVLGPDGFPPPVPDAENDFMTPPQPSSVSRETLETIIKTMRGRRIFISTLKDTRTLPVPKKFSLSLAAIFHNQSKSKSPPTSPTPWPAIGVAASYAKKDDEVYTGTIELRSWSLVTCPKTAATANDTAADGSRKHKTSPYGYFESQRSATFILRRYHEELSSEQGQQGDPTSENPEAGTGRRRKAVLQETSSSYGLAPERRQLLAAGDHQHEQGGQDEQPPQFWYVGECKTTRLLEVQPRGDKLNTIKLMSLVNQKRVRMQTILLR